MSCPIHLYEKLTAIQWAERNDYAKNNLSYKVHEDLPTQLEILLETHILMLYKFYKKKIKSRLIYKEMNPFQTI